MAALCRDDTDEEVLAQGWGRPCMPKEGSSLPTTPKGHGDTRRRTSVQLSLSWRERGRGECAPI